MENEETINTQPTVSTERPNVAALKKTSKRSRIVETVAKLNSIAEPAFDLVLIAQLQRMPEVEFTATISRVMAAIAAAIRDDREPVFSVCPRCSEPLDAPAVEVQLANFVLWQRQRPQYFQWCPREILQLEKHLRNHPGSVLIPNFAQSADVRKPSGQIHTWLRSGRVS